MHTNSPLSIPVDPHDTGSHLWHCSPVVTGGVRWAQCVSVADALRCLNGVNTVAVFSARPYSDEVSSTPETPAASESVFGSSRDLGPSLTFDAVRDPPELASFLNRTRGADNLPAAISGVGRSGRQSGAR